MSWPPPPGPPAPEPGKLPAWLRGNPFEGLESPITIQFDNMDQQVLVVWHLIGLLEAGQQAWWVDHLSSDPLIATIGWEP